MKKVFSLALVAGMFAFASCESKPAENDVETAETVETAEPTTVEGDTATTTDVTADTTAAPVQ